MQECFLRKTYIYKKNGINMLFPDYMRNSILHKNNNSLCARLRKRERTYFNRLNILSNLSLE